MRANAWQPHQMMERRGVMPLEDEFSFGWAGLVCVISGNTPQLLPRHLDDGIDHLLLGQMGGVDDFRI